MKRIGSKVRTEIQPCAVAISKTCLPEILSRVNWSEQSPTPGMCKCTKHAESAHKNRQAFLCGSDLTAFTQSILLCPFFGSSRKVRESPSSNLLEVEGRRNALLIRRAFHGTAVTHAADNQGIIPEENVKNHKILPVNWTHELNPIPYHAKNCLPSHVKKCLTFASRNIHSLLSVDAGLFRTVLSTLACN